MTVRNNLSEVAKGHTLKKATAKHVAQFLRRNDIVMVHSIFLSLSAHHVARAAPLMHLPAIFALHDALHFLIGLNATLEHSLGLGITPQCVTI